ncbi:MAG: hypothetical protein NC413_15875 [Muribaculum sp.]|nr:hypothetical protein [Muribaculum sp.]
MNIAFGNVDECCLAYTFLHEEQSAFKSAADGKIDYLLLLNGNAQGGKTDTLITIPVFLFPKFAFTL